MSEEKKPGGPDLTRGVLPADFAEGKLTPSGGLEQKRVASRQVIRPKLLARS